MRIFVFFLFLVCLSVQASAADPQRNYAPGHFALPLNSEDKGLVSPIEERQGGVSSPSATPAAARSVRPQPGNTPSLPLAGARPSGLDAMPCAGLSGRDLYKCRTEEAKKKLDSQSELSDGDALRLQQAMDRKQKTESALSNIMKKNSETQQGITQNLK